MRRGLASRPAWFPAPPPLPICPPPSRASAWYLHNGLQATKSDHGVIMERVTGIGGVFFRAKDPEILSAWYEDTFGVSRVPRDYSTAPWMHRREPQFSRHFQPTPIISATQVRHG